MLTVRVFAADLLLDASLRVNGIATGMMEELEAVLEVSGLAAIEGMTGVEGIGIGVKVWMSSGIEGVPVWLRNRATFVCLDSVSAWLEAQPEQCYTYCIRAPLCRRGPAAAILEHTASSTIIR